MRRSANSSSEGRILDRPARAGRSCSRILHEALLRVEQLRRDAPGDRQHLRLEDSCRAAPAPRRRRSSPRAARCAASRSARRRRSARPSRILMLTSWSERVDAGRVVDRVGVDASAGRARTRCGPAACSRGCRLRRRTLQRSSRAVDAQRVVGAVADLRVASRPSPSRRCRCRRCRARSTGALRIALTSSVGVSASAEIAERAP